MEAEAKEALILRLFRAFPSADNKVSRGVVDEYLDTVSSFSVEAIARAVRNFKTGSVKRPSHAFAPSAPELAIECSEQEDRVAWERHLATHDFVIEGSDEWRQLCELRGGTLPTREQVIDGVAVRGWDVEKSTVAEARKIALPAPMKEIGVMPQIKRMV